MHNPSPGAELTVLVSVRIDPTRGRATRSRADAAGVALAQRALGPAAEPRLLSAGPLPEAVARDYLAQGVGRLEQLALPQACAVAATAAAGPGLAEVVAVLAAACRDSRLVLAGARGEAGLGSGLLPYALARQLQRPLIHDVIDLQREADGAWRVVQALPRGARHLWRLAPGQAAVLVSSPRLALREDLPQRHAWAAAQAGRIDATAVAPLPVEASIAAAGRADWQHERARKQRRPLQPVSTESGAARMARATGSADSGRKGGVLIQEGSTQDKAQALLAHLRRLALVA